MSGTSPDRDTLRSAVALATRAPSVHNTQPWRWLLGKDSVHLYADWTRQVPATDPDGRDLVLSCGATLHHLRVALAALGWATTVHRIPNPTDTTHLAAIEMRPHEPTDDDITLAALIQRRRTDRRRFSSWPVHPDLVDLLVMRARQEGVLAIAVNDPVTRFLLAGAIAQAAIIQEGNPDYPVELALWSGRGHGAADGVLAANIPPPDSDYYGDGRVRMFPHGTLVQPRGKTYDEQAALLVIATTGDDLLSRLRAGEATSAALLAATDLGLAACPLSQPLEVGDTRRAVRDDVLNGTAEPQLLLRLGWAPPGAAPLPASPRRDLDAVLSYLPD